MFGYIKTYTPELLVREDEYYKAIYCGLCRAQGKCTGQCSRFTLSYDMAFLALVRLAVSGEQVEILQGRCMAHPLRRRAYAKRNSELDFCAYASAILVSGKCSDDLHDEHEAKRLKATLVRPFASHMRRKSIRRYADLERAVTEGLRELESIEAQRLQSVDIPADIFGKILGTVCSYGYDGASKKILYDIGRHVGRWIYIADAIDDCDDDLSLGRYNPFVCLYGGRVPNDEERLGVADALRLELAEAELAFDLIEYGENVNIRGIIENIIYVGMPRVADGLAGKEVGSDKSKKSRKNQKKQKKQNKSK